MRTVITLLAALISSAAAAPAIVWTGESSGAKHSSDIIDTRSLISSATAGSSDSSLANVVFVVGRDEHGSDGLTGLASAGSLPKTAAKYSDASSMYHFVRGNESKASILKDAQSSASKVVQTNLADLQSAMKKPEGADLFLVNIDAASSPSDIDAAISSTIDNKEVGSFVLTAVRPISEVKLERDVNAKKQYFEHQEKAEKASRRRLDDGNGNDNGDNETKEAIYYVHFTPNIFSGFLFFLFFSVVTFIGMTCMGNIAGQDVYVSKYPVIGREA